MRISCTSFSSSVDEKDYLSMISSFGNVKKKNPEFLLCSQLSVIFKKKRPSVTSQVQTVSHFFSLPESCCSSGTKIFYGASSAFPPRTSRDCFMQIVSCFARIFWNALLVNPPYPRNERIASHAVINLSLFIESRASQSGVIQKTILNLSFDFFVRFCRSCNHFCCSPGSENAIFAATICDGIFIHCANGTNRTSTSVSAHRKNNNFRPSHKFNSPNMKYSLMPNQ